MVGRDEGADEAADVDLLEFTALGLGHSPARTGSLSGSLKFVPDESAGNATAMRKIDRSWVRHVEFTL
jgi:hypothetical protein